MTIILLLTVMQQISVVLLAQVFAQSTEDADDNNNDMGGRETPPPAVQPQDGPLLVDQKLTVEEVYRGLKYPTSMAFLAENDIIVLEKDDGAVMRITNGILSHEPMLDLPVAVRDERGLLGVAIAAKNDESDSSNSNSTYVFLYLTEAAYDAADEKGLEPIGNRLYRYELIDGHHNLVNAKRLLDLPAGPGTHHNGGALLAGPDGNLYLVIGDLEDRFTTTQNTRDGPPSDGTSVIYRITQDGQSAGSIFGGSGELVSKFYAYGIRNSFGMDFDPVTGMLWNTENGPTAGDEINLVEPGFNSGWRTVQGMMSSANSTTDILVKHPQLSGNEASLVGRLESFIFSLLGKEGKYSDPEFVWRIPIGPTAIKFLDSDKLGEEYENDMFVGDINNGNIYHFELNSARTELALNGTLSDRIADNREEMQGIIFGTGFGGIVDIETGPDGYLYVLSFHRSEGTIFRIVPITTNTATIPEFSSSAYIATAASMSSVLAIMTTKILSRTRKTSHF